MKCISRYKFALFFSLFSFYLEIKSLQDPITQLECFSDIRRQRIDQLCGDGQPELPFTKLRSSWMIEKQEMCCHELGMFLFIFYNLSLFPSPPTHIRICSYKATVRWQLHAHTYSFVVYPNVVGYQKVNKCGELRRNRFCRSKVLPKRNYFPI